MRITKQTVVLDKYRLGKDSYDNDNYTVEYGVPDKLTSRKITSTTFYLKNYMSWKLDDIVEYFEPKFDEWYYYSQYTRDNIKLILENIKKTRVKQIIKEYNREYNIVRFCQKEIDYINSFDLNTGRLIFLLMCICKQYGYKHFTFTPNWVRKCYNGKINGNRINKSIYNACKYNLLEKHEDGKIKISESLLNMYDDNPVCEFDNLGNISLLFDYVTGRNNNVIFCSKCGKIVEKIKNNQKYCNECAYEVNRDNTKERMKNIRKIANV